LVATFRNELQLIDSVHHVRPFGLFVTGPEHPSVSFHAIGNLFHPRTVDESFAHDGHGPVPGIKNDDGTWELRGHRARIVPITDEELTVFAQLFDEAKTPAGEARLPVVHSAEILHVLRAFARQPKLGPPGDRWGTTREWNEGDRTKDGTIL